MAASLSVFRSIAQPEEPAMARKPLNLYLVHRSQHVKLDETSGAVIAAATEGDAREFATTLRGDQRPDVWYGRHVTVTLVGQALPDAVGGVVFSEFIPG
jgi:hypothetical protein